MPRSLAVALDLRSLSPVPSPTLGRARSSEGSSRFSRVNTRSEAAASEEARLGITEEALGWRARVEELQDATHPPASTATFTEDDWYRFPRPTREMARRSLPFVENVGRTERGGSRRDRDFKVVGEWRIGESLGKGSSGAFSLRSLLILKLTCRALRPQVKYACAGT
jgi:hypothetical protein